MIDFQSKNNVAIDGAPLEKMIVLKHVSDSGAALFFHTFLLRGRKMDFSAFRRNQTGDDRQKRGFTAAGRADDCQEFSFFYLERYMG